MTWAQTLRPNHPLARHRRRGHVGSPLRPCQVITCRRPARTRLIRRRLGCRRLRAAGIPPSRHQPPSPHTRHNQRHPLRLWRRTRRCPSRHRLAATHSNHCHRSTAVHRTVIRQNHRLRMTALHTGQATETVSTPRTRQATATAMMQLTAGVASSVRTHCRLQSLLRPLQIARSSGPAGILRDLESDRCRRAVAARQTCMQHPMQGAPWKGCWKKMA